MCSGTMSSHIQFPLNFELVQKTRIFPTVSLNVFQLSTQTNPKVKRGYEMTFRHIQDTEFPGILKEMYVSLHMCVC